jgi:hypothetical protein
MRESLSWAAGRGAGIPVSAIWVSECAALRSHTSQLPQSHPRYQPGQSLTCTVACITFTRNCTILCCPEPSRCAVEVRCRNCAGFFASYSLDQKRSIHLLCFLYNLWFSPAAARSSLQPWVCEHCMLQPQFGMMHPACQPQKGAQHPPSMRRRPGSLLSWLGSGGTQKAPLHLCIG